MTGWLARKCCKLDDWWSGRRGRASYLTTMTEEASGRAEWSAQKAARANSELMQAQGRLNRAHMLMAAMVKAKGGSLALPQRFVSELKPDESLVSTEDLAYIRFEIRRPT